MNTGAHLAHRAHTGQPLDGAQPLYGPQGGSQRVATRRTRESSRRRRLATAWIGSALIALPLLLACGSGVPSIAEVRDLQAQGRFEESIAPLHEVLKADPQNAEASVMLGVAYFRTLRPSLAIWPLRKAEEDPEWAERAAIFGAMALLQSNNNEDAILAASRALTLNPDNLEALGLRAQARLAAVKDLEEGLADINRVFELDPDNGTALQPKASLLIKLERLEEAAEIIDVIEERAITTDETGKPDARWCLTNAVFAHENDDLTLAEQRFERCMEKYPEDPRSISEAIRFYSETGRPERAEEILRDTLRRKPGSTNFAADLAARLRARGDNEEASDVLEACLDAQTQGREFDALWALVEHYEAIFEFEAAADALRRAIPLNSDGRLPFRLVDILIRAGKHGEALQVAEQLDQEVYVELAKGRILLDQGRPRQALEHLTAGIRLWPNNPGARYYAALAAEQIGDFDRAILEYRDSIRSGADDTDAGLRLAKLLYAQGMYSEAMGALEHHTAERPRGISGHGHDAETLELGIKLATSLARRGQLQYWAAQLAAIPGQAGLAVSLEARAAVVAGGETAVVSHIRQSGLDLKNPENIKALRTLVRSLLTLGASDRALAEVDEAIEMSPAGGFFHELRAQVLQARRAELSEIRDACERALKFDPNDARNRACLAWVEKKAGNTRAAVALYQNASDADPEEVRYPLAAARALLDAGEFDEAERLLREALIDFPYDGRAAAVLARNWVERGVNLDRALVLSNRAIRFGGGAAAMETKGWIQLERGDAGEAVITLGRALAASEGSPSVRYRLARALAADGRTQEARQALGKALESKSFPEREAAVADLKRLSS